MSNKPINALFRQRFIGLKLPEDDVHSSKHVGAVQATLVIRDLTLRVFAITRFRGKKSRDKIVQYNFAVTVYGGGVTVWCAHQLVTSYQYQSEGEC
jgi:hypothetical protein